MNFQDVVLRAPEPEDLELLYKWENNSAYWTISNTTTPFSRFTLKRYIENSHKTVFETGQARFMIDLASDQNTIGTIDIFDFDAFHSRAGVGILIAEEEQRRKGYASMALQCLIDYCFETLHLHQLYCNILEDNCGSMELFGKMGFKRIGIKKDWVKTTGGFLDEYMFQLLNPAEEKPDNR
ncbi:MAG TPA: GNAT family N-acetyltransferase [Bacteroidales bacterium]|nr:GNAT family N-acetyltransferase [Bacteroidales bacterium]